MKYIKFYKQITYESMPFYHSTKIVEMFKNQLPNSTINTQPNKLFIENDTPIDDSIFYELKNAKIQDNWEKEGLFYDECKNKIYELLKAYKILNLQIIHKVAALLTKPKLIIFKYDDICDFKLPNDIILSVMNEQFIFFTEDRLCILICDEISNPNLQNIKNVLQGRLFDPYCLLQYDLQHDLPKNNESQKVLEICKQITSSTLSQSLASTCFDDKYTKLTQWNLGLMGLVSAIKFNNNLRRQIHVYDDNIPQDIQAVQVAIELNKLQQYSLPTGHLDPFGLKKSANYIVKYALKYGLNLPIMQDKIIHFLNKRLISNVTGFIKHCKQINWSTIHIDKNVSFDIKNIIRLQKLIKSKYLSSNYVLNEEENNLLHMVQNIQIIEIDKVARLLINYVEKYRICDYQQRQEIIEIFVNFVISHFTLNKLK